MAASSITSSSSSCNGTLNEVLQQYPYPSHVNAASFLSIKLAGKFNFDSWQAQVLCLVESHDMIGFIDGSLKNPKQNRDLKKIDWSVMEVQFKECKRSDTLVKGWIFGSLSEDVMDNVASLRTANDVWKKLHSIYGTPPPAPTIIASNDQADYIPLYKASLSGDWEKARDIFNDDKDALTVKLNDEGDTPLHIAIGTCKNLYFVENLLKEMTPESLSTLVTNRKSNPLHHAAFVGNTRAAEMLVEKNPNLLFLIDNRNSLPIHRAIYGSHTETFLYLLNATKDNIRLCEQKGYDHPFRSTRSAVLLTSVIGAGLYDAAYGLIKEYPETAIKKKGNIIPLRSIAGKLDVYSSGKRYNFYQRFVYSHVPIANENLRKGHEIRDIENQETVMEKKVPGYSRSCFLHVTEMLYVKLWKVGLLHLPHIKQLQKEKLNHSKALMILKSICKEVGKLNRISEIREHYLEAITLALINDNTEAVEEIVRSFPQAISPKDNDYPLVHMAIINRCEKVYNFLVYHVMADKHAHKVRIDEYGNNLLHLAGQLAPIHKLNQVSGAALQMQRELQWFQEVKNFACPWHEKTKNKKQETPIMVFRREHKELRKEGEEWMKKTADSYTITAALIITIVFAAAITVPGGTNGDTGRAIYAKKSSFIIFAVSDAISLFTSTTSLLLFLSILTARYAEEDFLYKLPKRLIFGLAMLFLSVTSMMVAFSATLYLMFGHGKAWILIPIATLTCLPIASFVTLQLPLLVDLISSTYGHGIFAKESVRRMKQS